jgi:beta-lactam-binding protein with PASTA domain/tRNA A-37 threonylcarbamoyl transferase component Bud32
MAQLRLLSGRYLLDELVGSGGMAEVYRARDLRLNRIIAVKMLRSDLASDRVFRERFRREAQSAASLSHRSIIAVHDTGEDVAGQVRVPYIVMEYQDGRTLDALLREGGRLRPERALEITDGILGALDYSHRNGIVHRDIKPSNVMVTGEGDVKVMDFGIARSMSGSQSTITQTAEVIGTAQYMSPEQARGERVDARSDLYSAGCVLNELLTGRPPFTGGSAVAIAYQHVCQDPVPPSEADPQMPRWADAIVLRAMAKAPADRYQNAGQMRAGIHSALSGPPGALPPARLLPQAQTLGAAITPVPASQVSDGPAAAPALTGPAPGEPHGPGEVADGTVGEPPRRRRRRKALWLLAGLAALAAVVAFGYLLFAGGGGKRYAVPEVRGLTQQQAGQKITADHLRPLFLNRLSRSVPNGVVIGTSPAGRTVVAAGTVVQVFVSAGQPQVPVPDVTGEDAGTARARLTHAGLHSRVRADSTSTAPAGTVTRQAPPAATKVPSGSTVTIWVAAGGTGAGGTRVRDVIGDPASTAKIILTGQGFTVKEVTRPGRPSAPAGTVYRQTPAAGSVLAPGSTVTIYIEPAAPPPSRIVAAPAALSVPQGSNGTFGVTLSAPPASTVTVTVSRTSGNPGLSVGSGATLTFTSSNWGTAQEVSIAADSSGAGPAAFAATAADYQPATITVTETPASSTAATSPAVVAAAVAAGTSPQRMPEALAAQAFNAPAGPAPGPTEQTPMGPCPCERRPS